MHLFSRGCPAFSRVSLDALEELDDVRSVITNLEAEETLMQGVLA
jgi:hypothetical protein